MSNRSKYGLLKIFANDTGDKCTKVPLGGQGLVSDYTYTIGSDTRANIKLIRQGVDPIHCQININDDGLATIVCKSQDKPIPINGKDVAQEMYLIHNDEFTIMGKRFKYENEELPPAIVKEAKRANMERWRNLKRVTVGGFISKTPQYEKPLRLQSRRSNSLDNLSTKPAQKAQKLFSKENSRIIRYNSLSDSPCPSKPDNSPFTTGFIVSTPKSETKPSLRSSTIMKNAVLMNFDEPEIVESPKPSTSKDVLLDRQDCVKTPVNEFNKENIDDESEVATPLNNTSVILVDTPATDETTLRSRKSKAKDIAIQRLTRNDESIVVLDSPSTQTPKSTLGATLEKTPKSALKKSKLIDEFSEEEDVTSTSDKTSIIVIDQSSAGSLSEVNNPTYHWEDTSESDTEVMSDASLKPSRLGATTDGNIEDSLSEESLIRSRRLSRKSCFEASKSNTDVSVQEEIISTPENPTKHVNFDIEDSVEKEFNLKMPLCSTPGPVRVVKNLEASFKESEEESLDNAEEGTEEGSSQLSSTSGSDNGVDIGVKRKRVASSTTDEEASRKRLKTALNDTTIAEMNSFTSQDCLSENENEMSVLQGDEDELNISMGTPVATVPVRKAFTEPRQQKKMNTRRSLSVHNANHENEPFMETSNTTVETVDTSSFVYVKNNVSFENAEFGSPSVDEKDDKLKQVQKEPLNDLNDLAGVKKLMQTPKVQKEPLNDLTSPKGVKQLMKTPKANKEAVNDLSNVSGIKDLMKTPGYAAQSETEEGVSDEHAIHTSPFVHVKNNVSFENAEFGSPSVDEKVDKLKKVQKQPLNDLSDLAGVKKLMQTPKVQKEPLNDLTSLKGVKQLMQTPKVNKDIVNDLSNVSGIKDLMKTPGCAALSESDASVPDEHAVSVFNMSGVSTLLNDEEDLFPRKKLLRTYGKSLPANAKSIGKKTSRKSEGLSTETSPDVAKWVDTARDITLKTRKSMRKSVKIAVEDKHQLDQSERDLELDADEVENCEEVNISESPVKSSRKSIRRTLDQSQIANKSTEFKVTERTSATPLKSKVAAQEDHSYDVHEEEDEILEGESHPEEIQVLNDLEVESIALSGSSVKSSVDFTFEEIKTSGTSGMRGRSLPATDMIKSTKSSRKTEGILLDKEPDVYAWSYEANDQVDSFKLGKTSNLPEEDEKIFEGSITDEVQAGTIADLSVNETITQQEEILKPARKSSIKSVISEKDYENVQPADVDDIESNKVSTDAESAISEITERDAMAPDGKLPVTVSSRAMSFSTRKSIRKSDDVEDIDTSLTEHNEGSDMKTQQSARKSTRKSMKKTGVEVDETSHATAARMSVRTSINKQSSTTTKYENKGEGEIIEIDEVLDVSSQAAAKTPQCFQSSGRKSSRKSLIKAGVDIDETTSQVISRKSTKGRSSLYKHGETPIDIDTNEEVDEETLQTTSEKKSLNQKFATLINTPAKQVRNQINLDTNEVDTNEVGDEPTLLPTSLRQSIRKSISYQSQTPLSRSENTGKKSSHEEAEISVDMETNNVDSDREMDESYPHATSARRSVRKSIKIQPDTTTIYENKRGKSLIKLPETSIESGIIDIKTDLVFQNPQTNSTLKTYEGRTRKYLNKPFEIQNNVETTVDSAMTSPIEKRCRTSKVKQDMNNSEGVIDDSLSDTSIDSTRNSTRESLSEGNEVMEELVDDSLTEENEAPDTKTQQFLQSGVEFDKTSSQVPSRKSTKGRKSLHRHGETPIDVTTNDEVGEATSQTTSERKSINEKSKTVINTPAKKNKQLESQINEEINEVNTNEAVDDEPTLQATSSMQSNRRSINNQAETRLTRSEKKGRKSAHKEAETSIDMETNNVESDQEIDEAYSQVISAEKSVMKSMNKQSETPLNTPENSRKSLKQTKTVDVETNDVQNDEEFDETSTRKSGKKLLNKQSDAPLNTPAKNRKSFKQLESPIDSESNDGENDESISPRKSIKKSISKQSEVSISTLAMKIKTSMNKHAETPIDVTTNDEVGEATLQTTSERKSINETSKTVINTPAKKNKQLEGQINEEINVDTNEAVDEPTSQASSSVQSNRRSINYQSETLLTRSEKKGRQSAHIEAETSIDMETNNVESDQETDEVYSQVISAEKSVRKSINKQSETPLSTPMNSRKSLKQTKTVDVETNNVQTDEEFDETFSHETSTRKSGRKLLNKQSDALLNTQPKNRKSSKQLETPIDSDTNDGEKESISGRKSNKKSISKQSEASLSTPAMKMKKSTNKQTKTPIDLETKNVETDEDINEETYSHATSARKSVRKSIHKQSETPLNTPAKQPETSTESKDVPIDEEIADATSQKKSTRKSVRKSINLQLETSENKGRKSLNEQAEIADNVEPYDINSTSKETRKSSKLNDSDLFKSSNDPVENTYITSPTFMKHSLSQDSADSEETFKTPKLISKSSSKSVKKSKEKLTVPEIEITIATPENKAEEIVETDSRQSVKRTLTLGGDKLIEEIKSTKGTLKVKKNTVKGKKVKDQDEGPSARITRPRRGKQAEKVVDSQLAESGTDLLNTDAEEQETPNIIATGEKVTETDNKELPKRTNRKRRGKQVEKEEEESTVENTVGKTNVVDTLIDVSAKKTRGKRKVAESTTDVSAEIVPIRVARKPAKDTSVSEITIESGKKPTRARRGEHTDKEISEEPASIDLSAKMPRRGRQAKQKVTESKTDVCDEIVPEFIETPKLTQTKRTYAKSKSVGEEPVESGKKPTRSRRGKQIEKEIDSSSASADVSIEGSTKKIQGSNATEIKGEVLEELQPEVVETPKPKRATRKPAKNVVEGTIDSNKKTTRTRRGKQENNDTETSSDVIEVNETEVIEKAKPKRAIKKPAKLKDTDETDKNTPSQKGKQINIEDSPSTSAVHSPEEVLTKTKGTRSRRNKADSVSESTTAKDSLVKQPIKRKRGGAVEPDIEEKKTVELPIVKKSRRGKQEPQVENIDDKPEEEPKKAIKRTRRGAAAIAAVETENIVDELEPLPKMPKRTKVKPVEETEIKEKPKPRRGRPATKVKPTVEEEEVVLKTKKVNGVPMSTTILVKKVSFDSKTMQLTPEVRKITKRRLRSEDDLNMMHRENE